MEIGSDSHVTNTIASVALIISCACVIVIGSWRIWIRHYSAWKQNNPLPWIGDVLKGSRQPHLMFKQLHDFAKGEGNHTFLAWIGPKPMLFFSKTEYIEPILSSRTLLKKGPNYRFLREWLGTGLLLSDGEKWKTRRRLITPTFHFNILNEFASIFEEQAVILVQKLAPLANTATCVVDIQVPVSLAKLDAMCETSMGVKINAQHSPTSEYVEAINSLTTLIQLRQRSPWLWPPTIYKHTPSGRMYYKNLKVLHEFTRDVIHKSIALRAKGRDQANSDEKEGEYVRKKKVFLDMLLDMYDGGEIDIAGVQEEVDTFLFEGHDTTASALSWTLYELGRKENLGFQEKLYQEITSADPNLSIVDKVRSLKYLDAVAKEGMRLHPPVPIFSRMPEEDVFIEGKLIPRGTEIGIFTYALHRNVEYWDEPDSFNPERFLDERYMKRDPYSFIPFSAGSRNCVGQKFAMLEEKIMLYYLISSYRVTSLQEESEVKGCMEIIHKSENGLLLFLASR